MKQNRGNRHQSSGGNPRQQHGRSWEALRATLRVSNSKEPPPASLRHGFAHWQAFFFWENEDVPSNQVFPLSGGRSLRRNGGVPRGGTGPLPTGDAGEVNGTQSAAKRDQEQLHLPHLCRGLPCFSWGLSLHFIRGHTGTPSELLRILLCGPLQSVFEGRKRVQL